MWNKQLCVVVVNKSPDVPLLLLPWCRHILYAMSFKSVGLHAESFKKLPSVMTVCRETKTPHEWNWKLLVVIKTKQAVRGRCGLWSIRLRDGCLLCPGGELNILVQGISKSSRAIKPNSMNISGTKYCCVHHRNAEQCFVMMWYNTYQVSGNCISNATNTAGRRWRKMVVWQVHNGQ